MIILVLAMHALLAVIFPVGRAVAHIASPAFATGVRMVVGGMILLVYQMVRRGILVSQLKQVLLALLVFTLTGIYLTNVLEFWALEYIPAAKASFIYSLSPFAAAVLSYFFFQEKMTLKKLLGMFIGLIGFTMMIIHHAPGESAELSIGFLSAAEGALIVAAITSAAGWIVMRRKARKTNYSTLEVLSISMILGGICCFIQSALLEPWNPIPIVNYPQNGIPFIGYMLLAIVCSNILGYTLYTMLLKKYTATFLSFAGFVEPICAALYGWIFLGEVVTKYFFISTFFVFIGLYIFYMEENRQGYITL